MPKGSSGKSIGNKKITDTSTLVKGDKIIQKTTISSFGQIKEEVRETILEVVKVNKKTIELKSSIGNFWLIRGELTEPKFNLGQKEEFYTT